MATDLSVHQVPDELMERLRKRAKLHSRSVQEEVMAMLAAWVGSDRTTLSELARQGREGGIRTGDESAAMIREDRDAR